MQQSQTKLAVLAAEDEQHTLLQQLDQDLLLVEAQVLTYLYLWVDSQWPT